MKRSLHVRVIEGADLLDAAPRRPPRRGSMVNSPERRAGGDVGCPYITLALSSAPSHTLGYTECAMQHLAAAATGRSRASLVWHEDFVLDVS